MLPKSLRPLKPAAFDYWKAQHLLNRAGFGGTPSEVRALSNMGLEKAVEHAVDYEAIEVPRVRTDLFDKDIMGPLPRQQREAIRRARQAGDEAALAHFRSQRQQRQRSDRAQMADLQTWWLTRMIETARPLQEKMTLFWHGHFATSYRAIEDSYHMFLQNQLFRHHAVGSFKALVHGIIRDPAMLRYLNNNQNRKEQPNENLARELMELFTLGEGHDYTEEDIKQGARALTGYTYFDDAFIDLGSRRYQRLHDQGPKRILGKTGTWNGDDFVAIIFSRRAASEFISWKLYRFFINDLAGAPSDTARRYIVDLGKLLRERNYRLKPVLKALFASEHFYDPVNVASTIKSPIQLIVGAIRSLRTPSRELRVLLQAADLMGQNIFYPPSVQGWEGGRAWINTSTMFVRRNLMVYVLTGRRPGRRSGKGDGSHFDASGLLDHFEKPLGAIDVRDAVKYLLWFNLGREPHEHRIDALVEHVMSRGGRLNDPILIELLLLITAMPEYQLC
ncbi:MAG: DUF1800 domain-containing protein [Planctomycetota bacterium]